MSYSKRLTVPFLVVLLTCAVSGCTTMRPLELTPSEPITAVRANVQPGDTVSIVTTDGRKLQFEVTMLGAEAITGADRAREPVTIPYSAIESIKVREFSSSKTVLGVSIGVGSLLLLDAALSTMAFFP